VPTAAFLYDVAGFSAKWLADVAADQWDDGTIANISPCPPAEGAGGPVRFLNGSAGWGDAVVIVPWEIYRAYGDDRLLGKLWPHMVRWLDRAGRMAAGGRHPSRTGDPRPHERYLWDTGFHWGEWLEPGDDMSGPFEEFVARDKSDVATAYFARSAELASRIATVLGRPADADRYAGLAAGVRAAWQAEFIDADGTIRPATQATIVRALTFGLVPPNLRARAAAQLVRLIRAAGTHLGTGFLATPDLLPALAETGHQDLAYELLFQDTPPSWLGMIDRGATTVWELWEGIDDHGVPRASLNHYSKGAVISFLHRYTAGIRIGDEPAYRAFRVEPVPGGGLTSAFAAHESPYGRIESSWTLDGSRFRLEVLVPPGTTATVVLPGEESRRAGPGRHGFTWSLGPYLEPGSLPGAWVLTGRFGAVDGPHDGGKQPLLTEHQPRGPEPRGRRRLAQRAARTAVHPPGPARQGPERQRADRRHPQLQHAAAVRHRRKGDHPQRPPRLLTCVQFRPDLLVVGAELGHGRGRRRPVQADELGAGPLLVHEDVEIRGGEPQPAAPGYLGAGGDLAAMHPQQQLGFVDPVPRAVGVGPGEPFVDLAHPAPGPFGLGRRPERARLDEHPGPPQPGPAIHRLGDTRGVLQRAAYHPRVQRLQVQRAQGRHPHDPAAHDLPGHRPGAEQALIFPARIVRTRARVGREERRPRGFGLQAALTTHVISCSTPRRKCCCHRQSRLPARTGTTLKRR